MPARYWTNYVSDFTFSKYENQNLDVLGNLENSTEACLEKENIRSPYLPI